MKFEYTHLDKVLYPKDKITKEEVIDYYEKISSRILPLMKNRLITMQRYPHGISQKGFIQKHTPDYFPSWIKTKNFKTKAGEMMTMTYCNDKDTLLYLANQDCLTFHIGLSQITSLDMADRIIFDIDPPSQKDSLPISAAIDLKEILEGEFKLKCYLTSTGKRGVHVYVFLSSKVPFEKTRAFAKKVSNMMVDIFPDRYSADLPIAKRKGKIFIDYLRNGFGQTAVCPYSLRAVDTAPIAMPLTWLELKKNSCPKKLQVRNLSKRLSVKQNAWKAIQKCSLATALKK